MKNAKDNKVWECVQVGRASGMEMGRKAWGIPNESKFEIGGGSGVQPYDKG